MEGVRSLHLRLLDSIALLLYQSVPDGGLKIGGGKEVGESVGEDLVSEEVEAMKKKGDVKKGPVIGKNMEKAVKKFVKNFGFSGLDRTDRIISVRSRFGP